jgi:FkbM family methyltransferase
VQPLLPLNPVIIECGGFDGRDTVLMASRWPKGKIYTFEPVPLLFKRIVKRTHRIPNIKAYPLALADKTGKMIFFLSDYNNSGNPSGSSSLLPPKDHKEFDQKVTFNGQIEVDAMTLDDWAAQEHVDHIDFMWLDMQGYELNMLKASKLAKKVKVIYLEVIFIEAYKGQPIYADIKKWMKENGFELIALDFNEDIALLGNSVIKPGSNFPYYGNAVFLNKNI